MVLPLDKTLINIGVDVIDKNLREMKAIVGEGEELFLKEYRNTLAGKHALLESIEACIDMVGNHITVDDGRVFAIMKKDSGDMCDFAKAVFEFTTTTAKTHS